MNDLTAQVGAAQQTTTSGSGSTLSDIINWLIDLINGPLVTLIFALAFILFLFGVFRYFFSSGAKAEENRQEGRKFIMWGIIAFAVMVVIWGLVNLVAGSVPGLKDQNRPDLPCFSGNCNTSTK